MDPAALLADLTDAQAAAVTSAAAPLCVIAGAGSGKTRVLTRRIAWRAATATADPAHVLAVTFTRKAAAELRQRLRGLGLREAVAAGTFHGIALTQLRQWWADQGRRPPALLADPRRLLAPLAAAAGAPVPAVAAEISWARARRLDPEAYAASAGGHGRRPPVPVSVVAECYAAYQLRKRRRGVIDLDDVVEDGATAFEDDPGFAARQRWRFRHLFVDEYQDLNPAHFRLVRAWLGNELDLCVVGDPRQAVYGWNGADPTLLDRFPEQFPTAEVLRLDDNFRSTAEIVTVAAAVRTARPARPPATDTLRARAEPGEGPVPVVHGYRTEEDEADAIARAVRDLHAPGTPWSWLAVLARTNARLDPVAEALRRAGIPFRRARDRTASPSEAARELLDARLAAGPWQPASVVLGDGRLALADGPGDQAQALARFCEDVEAFCQLDPGGTVAALATWLSAGGLEQAGADGVTLSSFHRAKGLEWPTVFVAGLEAGLVPHALARGRAAQDEEARLLYVALTRAGRRLHCSWAGAQGAGAGPGRDPSPFVPALEAAVRELVEARRPADGRAGVALVRRQLESLAAQREPGRPPSLRSAHAVQDRAALRRRAPRGASRPPRP